MPFGEEPALYHKEFAMPTADTTEQTIPPRQELQEQWLDTLLPLIGDMGWTSRSIKIAAEQAGLDAADQALAAPDGVDSLIEAFLARGDRAMLAAIEAADLPTLRVRDRVALAVMAWLDALADHKPAFRRALGLPRAEGDRADLGPRRCGLDRDRRYEHGLQQVHKARPARLHPAAGDAVLAQRG
jgi:hypothetical protein